MFRADLRPQNGTTGACQWSHSGASVFGGCCGSQGDEEKAKPRRGGRRTAGRPTPTGSPGVQVVRRKPRGKATNGPARMGSRDLQGHASVQLPAGPFYYFCRVHGSLKGMPTMKVGLTGHRWTVDELLMAAGIR